VVIRLDHKYPYKLDVAFWGGKNLFLLSPLFGPTNTVVFSDLGHFMARFFFKQNHKNYKVFKMIKSEN